MRRLLAVKGSRPSSISRRHRLRRSHGRAENCNCSGNGNEALLAHKSPDSIPRSRMPNAPMRSEEHTSELQSLMRISYAVFCLKKKIKKIITQQRKQYSTIRNKIHNTHNKTSNN